jgi:hypothetical protein
MPSLDESFDEVARRLGQPASLAAARSDPFYYFVYPPEDALEVKRKLPVWMARLRNDGVQVERVSFADLAWDLILAAGRWDTWLEAEAEADPEQVNEAVRDVLRTGNSLTEKVAGIVGRERPGTVVFLTETELLHPYFRVRTLESALHDRVKVPTVVFYPGRRVGQFGLSFLGFYPEDGNYRATLIGGLP